MARHRRVTNLEEDKPELSISPLIDICFLLLIYFLVTTTIKQKERDNSMALPSAAPSEAQPDIQPFFIKVSSDGHIFANVGAAQELLDTEVLQVRTAKEIRLGAVQVVFGVGVALVAQFMPIHARSAVLGRPSALRWP